MINSKTIIVLGPTATGKTKLGVALANHFSGEIISADSRQVYRGMDIGTGKDLHDFTINGIEVPHHLIDVAEPSEVYNLFRFVGDAYKAINDIRNRAKLPFIVGGTPLYINALLNGYDLEGGEPNYELRKQLQALSVDELEKRLLADSAEVYERTDLTQKARIIRAIEIVHTKPAKSAERPPKPMIEPLIIAPYYQRKITHARIEKRLNERLAEGMIEEVQGLYDQGISWGKLDYFGLEYRYISYYLQGKLTRKEMRDELFIHIRRFCKRQDIWFRKMEREGKVIHWLADGNLNQAKSLISDFLADKELPAPQFQLKDVFYGPRSD